jgi:hypothetical protein
MTAINKVVIQGEDVRVYENRKKEGNARIIKDFVHKKPEGFS